MKAKALRKGTEVLINLGGGRFITGRYQGRSSCGRDCLVTVGTVAGGTPYRIERERVRRMPPDRVVNLPGGAGYRIHGDRRGVTAFGTGWGGGLSGQLISRTDAAKLIRMTRARLRELQAARGASA